MNENEVLEEQINEVDEAELAEIETEGSGSGALVKLGLVAAGALICEGVHLVKDKAVPWAKTKVEDLKEKKAAKAEEKAAAKAEKESKKASKKDEK